MHVYNFGVHICSYYLGKIIPNNIIHAKTIFQLNANNNE